MVTKLTSKRVLGLSTALVLTAALVPACLVRAQGVAERVGSGLDNAGRGIRRGVQGAFARAQASVHAQELISRVYSRIHWDKTLNGSTLELEVQADGTAVLRGVVPDAAAKQRAVVLARDTVGVTQVVDQLTVIPSGRVIPASPSVEVQPPPASATTVIKP